MVTCLEISTAYQHNELACVCREESTFLKPGTIHLGCPHPEEPQYKPEHLPVPSSSSQVSPPPPTPLSPLKMLFPLALAALVAPALAAPSDCRPLRDGVAPTPSPNTPEAFACFSYYASTANSTAHPANYERFMVGGDAAVRSDENYLTFKELSSYSVDQCAGACNGLASCASCE